MSDDLAQRIEMLKTGLMMSPNNPANFPNLVR